jgi:predicted NAD/FAD-dependent oxidoreductase
MSRSPISGAKRIAVIGAGMAGLTATATLRAAGMAVRVYDKGRKPGGRLATRHYEAFTFNHGCQFFSARDPRFLALTQNLGAEPWPQAGDRRFAGVPDMASLAGAMAAPLGADVQQNTHVSFIERVPDGWQLHLRDAATAPPSLVEPGGTLSAIFDAVILAIPAPQAATLLHAARHSFAARLAPVHLAPCWALMLGFVGNVDGPAVVKPATGPVAWIARENSRPGHPENPTAYTIHATHDWSIAHLEDSKESVAYALTSAFAAATGITVRPVFSRAHRWKYALAERPLGEPCLWDAQSRLGVCGDWCLDGKLEAAYLSGLTMAGKLIQ